MSMRVNVRRWSVELRATQFNQAHQKCVYQCDPHIGNNSTYNHKQQINSVIHWRNIGVNGQNQCAPHFLPYIKVVLCFEMCHLCTAHLVKCARTCESVYASAQVTSAQVTLKHNDTHKFGKMCNCTRCARNVTSWSQFNFCTILCIRYTGKQRTTRSPCQYSCT